MAAPSADQHDFDSMVRSLSTVAPSGLEPQARALLRRRELQLAGTTGQLLVVAAWRQALALQVRPTGGPGTLTSHTPHPIRPPASNAGPLRFASSATATSPAAPLPSSPA